MKTFYHKILYLLLVSILLVSCSKEKEKETEPINIILYNKSLSVIQEYIEGKWNLDYASGGIMGATYVDTINSYIIFSSDHITIGDDIRGIITDTTLIWKKVKIQEDSINVYIHPGTSIYTIVIEIKNSNLITSDYLADGFMYSYSR